MGKRGGDYCLGELLGYVFVIPGSTQGRGGCVRSPGVSNLTVAWRCSHARTPLMPPTGDYWVTRPTRPLGASTGMPADAGRILHLYERPNRWTSLDENALRDV